MNLSESFDALDDNLKLDPAERDRAIEAHNRLGDLLVAAGVAKRTRLQGSFARKTMLPPLKDIDKVIELVDTFKEILAGPGGPEKAMLIIQEILEEEMPGVTFEVKQHALGIVVPGDGFDFDAVPAFNEEDGTGWIKIADIDDDDWEPSNTYLLIDTIADRNEACEGRFVRQVRMVKQAVKIAGIDIPGLHVEAFAYDAVTTEMDHSAAVTATLSWAASALQGAYTDPTGVDRLDERLDSIQKGQARAGFQRLADLATKAQRLAGDGDEDGAALIWRDIFGDPFPKPDTAKDFLQQLHGGSGITSIGTVTPSVSTPKTRAWRP